MSGPKRTLREALGDMRKAARWWVRRILHRGRRWRDYVGADWPRRSRRARRMFLARLGQPETLRLARAGRDGEGDLFIGRIADADQFAGGLLLKVGRSPLPSATATNPKVRVQELAMNDGSNPPEGWVQWLGLVRRGVEAVRQGDDVLCCCDLGISRSVVLAGACVARLDDRPLDRALIRALRNTFYDGIEGGEFLPSESLWQEATAALVSDEAHMRRAS